MINDMTKMFKLLFIGCIFMILGCAQKSSEQEFAEDLIRNLKSPDPTDFAAKFWPKESEYNQVYAGHKITLRDKKTGKTEDATKKRWKKLKKDKHKIFALLMKQTIDWQDVFVDSISTTYIDYKKNSPTKEYAPGKAMIYEMNLHYHRKEVVCKVTIDGIRTEDGSFKIIKTRQRSCDEPY